MFLILFPENAKLRLFNKTVLGIIFISGLTFNDMVYNITQKSNTSFNNLVYLYYKFNELLSGKKNLRKKEESN